MLKKSSRKYSEMELLQVERWFRSTCQETLSIPWGHCTWWCFKSSTDGLHTSWRPVLMSPSFWGCDTRCYSSSLGAFVSLQCSAWWWCCNARSGLSLPVAPRKSHAACASVVSNMTSWLFCPLPPTLVLPRWAQMPLPNRTKFAIF